MGHLDSDSICFCPVSCENLPDTSQSYRKVRKLYSPTFSLPEGGRELENSASSSAEVVRLCTKQLWQRALAAVLSACWAENRDLSHCSRCFLEALCNEICLNGNSRTVGIIYTSELAKVLICLRGKKKNPVKVLGVLLGFSAPEQALRPVPCACASPRGGEHPARRGHFC